MQGSAPYAVTETLSEANGTTLYRAVGSEDRHPVILKVLDPGRCRPASLDRQRREYEFGRSLDLPVIARPLAFETFHGMPALVMEDFGGQPLDSLLGSPMPMERFLPLASRIARAVADIHRAGVIHRDLRPQNIIVNARSGEARLADFGLATRLPRERQVARPPHLLEGSLPYISPEQTGRIAAATDDRSDLYSLGVTFHQMVTGHLPFDARDPLEWVHCHVARPAPSAAEVVPAVPEMVARIILKLLAKMADDRYQTASGLEHDLARCLEQWRSNRRIDPFPLAERDTPNHLQIPQRLYGRDAEVAALRASLERVAQGGSPELVLISGYSGIGKSSLVHGLLEPIVRERALFVAGKFDPFQRDVPYSAFVKALGELVLDLVAEGEERIAAWKQRLETALGSNAQLVVDVVPPLALVIGRRPPVPELPPAEAQKRFRSVFRRFVEAFARREHPITLFLDDLQWADSASLALLHDLATQAGPRALLVIGAYRDNEVTPAHPLTLMLHEARRAGARVKQIALGPLPGEALTALVGDVLRSSTAQAAPLAALVAEKTGANPFFAIQFLSALHEERLLQLDERAGQWRWDLAAIRGRSFTENVIELMERKLRRLPADTQEALAWFACVGKRADVITLSIVLDRSDAQIHAVLWEAVREGLVVRAGEAYEFLHDRVREAAYSLVAEDSRPAAHLIIGRRLLERLPRDGIAERVFEVVGQLNRTGDLIVAPAERDSLCRLDALAGRRARASAAYASARKYFDAAVALLPSDAWSARYEEAFALHLDLAECEYLEGDFLRADEILDALLGQAGSDLDRGRVYLLRMILYQGTGRFEHAWQAGVDGLRLFGVSLPAADREIPRAFEAAMRELRAHVAGRSAADLAAAPEIVAPDARMMLRLLVELWVPAYNARPQYHPLLIATTVNLSLRQGNAPETSLAYVGCAALLVESGDVRSAFELGEASLRVAERYDDMRTRAAVVAGYGAMINHWRWPLATGLPMMDRGLRAMQEIGDLARAGIVAIIAAWAAVAERGDPLDEALRASEKYLAFAEESRNDTARDAIRLIRQLAPAMKGATREPASLDDDAFSEAACLAAFAKASFGAGIALHCVLKQVVAFLYGRYEEALEAATRKASTPAPVSAFLYDASHHFFHALTLAALHPGASADRQRELARDLGEELRRLEAWAKSCPENFLHRHALASAEAARIDGRELDAERLYEQAIRSARENRFLHDEALAYELASRFYRSRGLELFADAYLHEARASYARWGADGKVRQIDELLTTAAAHPPPPAATVAVRLEHLDLFSIVKALQTISGEIVIDRLAPTLLQVLLEQGGARRACVILARDGALSIAAQAAIDEQVVTTRALPPLPLESSSLVPASIVEYVRRTREPVALTDAAAQPGKFSSDPYLARARPRSVLCLPILRQTQLLGLLYLENDLVAGAFTRERLDVLTLIATQAAISAENAALLAKEQTARAAAEDAKVRLAFLAEAGALLSESLDYEETLARLAASCVPALADWCVVDVLEGREIRRVAGAHADATKSGVLEELQRRYPARPDSPHPAARVLRSGEPLLLAEVSDEALRTLCQDEEHRRLLRELGVDTALAVPLVARGKTLGAFTLAAASPGRRYGAADLDLAQQLAHRAALAVDNARLYRDAQEAIRARDEFLSVASHELYTPMTSLMLSSQALMTSRVQSEADPRTVGKLLDLIARQAQRLARLVGDLLDVSQIETGRLRIEPTELELGALVRDVADRLEPELARRGCSLSIRAGGPIHGRWDRSRLDQVVTNLLSNAVKFGPGKPVEISIAAEAGSARIAVRDQGIGISANLQARIFGRFERAVSVEHYGGLGFGLYISRRIVEAHGGSIRVESELDSGSTFTVEIPCAGPSEVSAAQREG